MGVQRVELPSRYFNPAIFAESPEEIAESTRVYSGNINYNPFVGKNNLPGIRGMGAYGGGMPYPRFTQDVGDVYVIQNRFEGEAETLPRLSVGTVATIQGCTVANIPTGRNFPNSTYEQRVVEERDTTKLAIGKAIFDFINGEEGEVQTSFFELLLKEVVELGRAKRHYRELRGIKTPTRLNIHKG
jgi:hypothetical protein